MDRRVRELMRRDFIRVSPEQGPEAVLRLMGMARVRELPVLEDGRLLGMVRHQDLAQAALAHARQGREALPGSISPYVRRVDPVSSDATLCEAGRRMLAEGLPCLAAVEAVDGVARVVGLLTESDLLRAVYRVVTRL